MFMSQGSFFERPQLEPVTNLIIEETPPFHNPGVNTSFSGFLPGFKNNVPGKSPNFTGYIEGFVEEGGYGDVDEIEVEPGWRGRGFGTQLFKHFVNYVKEREVETISLSAANERTAHLMGTIPDVKEYEFVGSDGPLANFSTELAVKYLQDARVRQGMDKGHNKNERLLSTIRITAYMR